MSAKITTSPWGKPDSQKTIAPGIIQVWTPSHGGFWVDPTRLHEMSERVPELLTPSQFFRYSGNMAAGAWFEEDSECARVFMAFPEFFPGVDQEEVAKQFAYFNPEIQAAGLARAEREASYV